MTEQQTLELKEKLTSLGKKEAKEWREGKTISGPAPEIRAASAFSIMVPGTDWYSMSAEKQKPFVDAYFKGVDDFFRSHLGLNGSD